MSKFVTYPAVTVLDNDHSLLIDSPNAGTNSITANNAANTLLSKWSGFDTFDEAVQNTISNNQEFIDRDAAIRSETAELKRKIVTTFPAKDASGQIATFESEFEDAPLKSCIVQVEPVQEGSGDPSPDNVRPISGFTGVEVGNNQKNIFDESVFDGVDGIALGQDGFYEGKVSAFTKVFSSLLPVKGKYIGNTIYTISCKYYFTDVGTFTGNACRFTVAYTDGTNGNILSLSTTQQASHYESSAFGYGSKSIKRLALALSDYRASNYILHIKDVQIELGSTATSYEPYTGRTYPITFPSEAGTIYGAYIDVINGELVVDRAMVDVVVNGDNGVINGNQQIVFTAPGKKGGLTNFVSNLFKNGSGAYGMSGRVSTAVVEFRVPLDVLNVTASDSSATRKAAFAEWLSNNPTQLCYELAEPIHYPLTPTEIKTLLGTNNIWADTGDVSVEYLMSDVGWYVEKKLRAFQSILAGVEDSAVASKNYSTDSYLIFNDDIYRVTKTITAGETIEDGVNVTKTTVAEQLMALAQV